MAANNLGRIGEQPMIFEDLEHRFNELHQRIDLVRSYL